ncbi:hypothetical protein [Marinithermus hydrothermalis]|uniref:Uncharacterized protein n=1 Tax=Marinithermus hydrothermalis (strain DSM 14884 / JCM 11576 / T1) TaxID=869210 RepID=F2NLK1_MARHT|nr:hypothetical protein [Marinithermus hydrothermalis]AEB12100.1 hypothetical protein Marky_1365 [Marinithermus hydrothermalis DSM 14884]
MKYRYTVVETLPLKKGASGSEFAKAFRELESLDGIAREYGVSPTSEIRIYRCITDPQKVKVVYRAEDMEALWQFYQDAEVHNTIKRVFDRFVDRERVQLEYWQEL